MHALRIEDGHKHLMELSVRAGLLVQSVSFFLLQASNLPDEPQTVGIILLSYSPADSSDADTSDSEWPLHIPAGADVCYSPHSGKPGLQVTTNSTYSYIYQQERDLNLSPTLCSIGL